MKLKSHLQCSILCYLSLRYCHTKKPHCVISNAALFVIASSSMFIVIHTVTGHRSFHTATLPYMIDALDFKNESCGLSNSVIYILRLIKGIKLIELINQHA